MRGSHPWVSPQEWQKLMHITYGNIVTTTTTTPTTPSLKPKAEGRPKAAAKAATQQPKAVPTPRSVKTTKTQMNSKAQTIKPKATFELTSLLAEAWASEDVQQPTALLIGRVMFAFHDPAVQAVRVGEIATNLGDLLKQVQRAEIDDDLDPGG